MMKKSFIALLAALMLAPALRADRGMWLPALIGTRIKDMRSKGFRLSAEDIYSVNKASLKDAVVLFNGGCTGELVSGEGLLLTNHHCGYGAIQSHSSVRHDYLTDGFWAMNRSEELPNPGLYVSFLVRMEDVTAQVLDGVRDDLPEARRDSLIRFNAVSYTHLDVYKRQFYGRVHHRRCGRIHPAGERGAVEIHRAEWAAPRHGRQYARSCGPYARRELREGHLRRSVRD